jgi:hypothetical protein
VTPIADAGEIDSNRFLHIGLNHPFLLMLEQSIKVSLITVTVERSMYLMVASW